MRKLTILLAAIFTTLLFMPIQAQNGGVKSDKYVVVLSLDGFRWDYVKKSNTPTLDSLARVGVYSQIFPCFPSNTFPNHYSMATGLHPNEHGIVNNSFTVKSSGKTFNMSNNENVADTSFWGGEPIWNCVERQGLKSAVFMWVGCSTPINGKLPSVSVAYNVNVSGKDRADMVVSQLCRQQDSIPNLIMWYVEEPDNVAHDEGPTSRKTYKCVEELDRLLGYFFNEAKKSGVYDKINFIITSDHGMAKIAKRKYINVYKYLDRNKIEYAYNSVPLFIEPKPEYLEQAYQALSRLPHMKVYKRNQIPSQYQFGSNADRISSLVVLPETGWTVDYRKNNKKKSGGAHGYDPFNTQMQMIFYGSGPAFRENAVAPAFQNLNLHNIIANILEVEPAPNRGDKEVIKYLFKRKK